MDFQRGSIPVDLAVYQSRLPDLYAPSKLATLQHFVRCPRCGEFARAAIWIHEHAAADDLEPEIERLGDLARRTPFLILEDPFAQKVLAEIRRLGATAAAQPLPHTLYRARAKTHIVLGPAGLPAISDFGPPPAEVVVEGRFNHTGLPMLYLADSIATTVAEIGAAGEEFYVAALEFTGEYKILDLIVSEPDEAEWELLGAIAASTLMAAPRTGKGWLKKEYIFTRFVADCAISAGFDCVRYGSTKLHTGCNYVLLAPPKDLTAVAGLTEVVLIAA